MYYIQSVSPDGKTMQNVMIWEPGRTTPAVQVLWAKSARIEGTDIILDRAVQTRINGDGQISAVDVIANEVRLPLPMGDNGQNFLSNSNNDTFTMNTARLSQDIKFRKATGQGGTDLAVREQALGTKYAYPFAAFIAVVLAVPLAVRFGKRGRTLGIVLSIVGLFGYYAMGALAAAFGKNGALNPYLAAWLPNIITAAAGAVLIWQEDR